MQWSRGWEDGAQQTHSNAKQSQVPFSLIEMSKDPQEYKGLIKFYKGLAKYDIETTKYLVASTMENRSL